ncbi:ABC transporter permease [Cellulomonas sp. PhB143]|uniref:ABC transporter permease n=1 Tax=Cellulomonas sp. PhB143 TaxID=2485186 RepID=UPI000F46EBAD|nr:ABC transporter permease [Cellulomonas sp. PhB143]ROS78588.1 putative ABC transport system permease protein [Cellulomonas sp. PhB143]
MVRITLAQMRRSIGRLSGAGIAVLIGTAFVTATLLAGAVINATMVGTVAARYADADLVVSTDDGSAVPVDRVAGADGVAAAEPVSTGYVELGSGARTTYQAVVATDTDRAFDPQSLTAGALPTADDEIALPADLADRFGLGTGDTITATTWVYDASDDSDPGTEQHEDLTVVGLVDDPRGAFSETGGAAVVTPAALTRLAPDAERSEAVVALDDAADPAAATAAIEAAVPDAAVRTTEAVAKDKAASMTGDQDVFTWLILCFAAVALVVAALVIANTFQVLVAQRARTLALLRCVGADRAQLARSVLLEASILGVAASVAGIVVGAGLCQAALAVAGRFDLGVPLPATVSVTAAAVLVPLAVGTAVTVVASLAPARAATRVAPLEALRPAAAPSGARSGGRVRLVVAALLVVGGVALLAGGVLLGAHDLVGPGLAAGVLGGAASFVGLLVGAVFWVPRLVALVGRIAARTGASGSLAAANTLRNPRRTTATSAALLIGVTLVTMMSTGAASARTSLTSELDAHYPVDVDVQGDRAQVGAGSADDAAALTPEHLAAVGAVDGVSDAVAVSGVTADVTLSGTSASVSLLALPASDAARVLRDQDAAAAFEALTDRDVLLTPGDAKGYDVTDGDTVTVTGARGPVDLTARVVDVASEGSTLYVTPATLGSIDPGAATSDLWARVADDADPQAVVGDVQDAVDDVPVAVVSPVAERASLQSAIDTMLAVVVGLLGVAVVIAVVGVANTLSLSVLERRRESATLRAIGLSRGQLRGMLAVEGVIVALVGAVAGSVLGVAYGWAGSAVALSVMGDVALTVPWRDLGIVLVVAVLAGLVASVVPGRTAARTSPVAALAVD